MWHTISTKIFSTYVKHSSVIFGKQVSFCHDILCSFSNCTLNTYIQSLILPIRWSYICRLSSGIPCIIRLRNGKTNHNFFIAWFNRVFKQINRKTCKIFVKQLSRIFSFFKINFFKYFVVFVFFKLTLEFVLCFWKEVFYFQLTKVQSKFLWCWNFHKSKLFYH